MEREDSEVRGKCRFPFLYPRGGRYRFLTFVGCSSIEAWLQPCVHGTDGLVRPVRRVPYVRIVYGVYMISGLDVRILYGLVRWVRIVCGLSAPAHVRAVFVRLDVGGWMDGRVDV